MTSESKRLRFADEAFESWLLWNKQRQRIHLPLGGIAQEGVVDDEVVPAQAVVAQAQKRRGGSNRKHCCMLFATGDGGAFFKPWWSASLHRPYQAERAHGKASVHRQRFHLNLVAGVVVAFSSPPRRAFEPQRARERFFW